MDGKAVGVEVKGELEGKDVEGEKVAMETVGDWLWSKDTQQKNHSVNFKPLEACFEFFGEHVAWEDCLVVSLPSTWQKILSPHWSLEGIIDLFGEKCKKQTQ